MTGKWINGKFVVTSHGTYFALTKEELADLRELLNEETRDD